MEKEIVKAGQDYSLSGINESGDSLLVRSKEGKEILRIADSGDIFVNGVLIENDKEVVIALRRFLSNHGYLPLDPNYHCWKCKGVSIDSVEECHNPNCPDQP